eukprot:TRINITY_DN76363_c0_g1_i1.p1 TRINITY_DN76363_c0_g1~~TRINITY_DN76363_c0_g1_i1.p1  ORF type:complete len:239 (+),score=58.49 TRINITY_DN76363_c0_g1_i1:284-1000(+)
MRLYVATPYGKTAEVTVTADRKISLICKMIANHQGDLSGSRYQRRVTPECLRVTHDHTELPMEKTLQECGLRCGSGIVVRDAGVDVCICSNRDVTRVFAWKKVPQGLTVGGVLDYLKNPSMKRSDCFSHIHGIEVNNMRCSLATPLADCGVTSKAVIIKVHYAPIDLSVLHEGSGRRVVLPQLALNTTFSEVRQAAAAALGLAQADHSTLRCGKSALPLSAKLGDRYLKVTQQDVVLS